MLTIEKKKLYNGLVEIRGNQRDKALRNKEGVKFILDDQYMIISYRDLKTKGIFINQQKSIINDGQMYDVWGYRWAPNGMVDTDLQIDPTVRLRLSQMYKDVLKKKQ